MYNSANMHQFLRTTLLLASITGLFLLIGNTIGGTEGMIMALFIATIMNFGAYFFSDRIVLAQYGAKEAEKSQYNIDLYSVVKRLSLNAHIPMPKVYVLDMPTPNAFATGRNPKNAVVAVSKSLMQALTQDELEGVIAHELGHIKNGDMLISTIAATLAGAISYLANIAMYSSRFRDRDDRRSSPFATIFLIILSPIIATILHMAISRSREFLADEYSAKLTKSPRSLISALQKIAGYAVRYPMQGNEISQTSASLFIINPFDHSMLMKLFSTHPPLSDRIARLDKIRP